MFSVSNTFLFNPTFSYFALVCEGLICVFSLRFPTIVFLKFVKSFKFLLSTNKQEYTLGPECILVGPVDEGEAWSCNCCCAVRVMCSHCTQNHHTGILISVLIWTTTLNHMPGWGRQSREPKRPDECLCPLTNLRAGHTNKTTFSHNLLKLTVCFTPSIPTESYMHTPMLVSISKHPCKWKESCVRFSVLTGCWQSSEYPRTLRAPHYLLRTPSTNYMKLQTTCLWHTICVSHTFPLL